MERIYQHILQQHLQHDRQMVFLAGPRRGRQNYDQQDSRFLNAAVNLPELGL